MQQSVDRRIASSGRRRQGIIGAVAIVLGTITTTVGISSGTTSAYDGYEARPASSTTNQASAWGSDCTKLDRGNGTNQFVADQDYRLVVLKAAQTDHVYTGVEAGDVLSSYQNNISHFIFCGPSAPTTTTTQPTTTTTQPAATTTTTQPATATTQPATTTTTTTQPAATTTTQPATTTTQPATTTTQPEIEPTLDIEALRPVCVADTPYIEYVITVDGIEADTATLVLRDVDGREVETLSGQPLSGRIIWPGAGVDPIDWPGWKLDGGLWVPDDSDALLRDGLFITAMVNPEATAEVEYPPATETCNGPEVDAPTTTAGDQSGPTTSVSGQAGPTTTQAGSAGVVPTTVSPQLPETGSGSTGAMVALGFATTLLGLTLLLGSRRPQDL